MCINATQWMLLTNQIKSQADSQEHTTCVQHTEDSPHCSVGCLTLWMFDLILSGPASVLD